VATIELHDVADAAEELAVLLAVQCGEHAGVVGDRGDLRSDGVAERFVLGVAAEVVETARAGRFGDDLQATGVGDEVEHGLAREAPLEAERRPVAASSVESLERVNAKAVSAYLGHASIQTTFDLYGHLIPGNEDEAVALVDAYLERATTARRIAQLDQ
jgi:hypothetical protein